MKTKLLLVFMIALALFLGFSAVHARHLGERFKPERIPSEAMVPVSPPVVQYGKDYCELALDDGVPVYYFSGWNAGDKNAIYFDPADCGGGDIYPFRLDTVKTMFYDFAGVESVDVRLSVHKAIDGDPCNGPGDQLYLSGPITVTTFFPSDWVKIPFPQVVYLEEPFFLDIQYASGDSGSIPSLMMDSAPTDTCPLWIYSSSSGFWYNINSFWVPPPKGEFLLRLIGETGATNDLGIRDTLYVETFDWDNIYEAEPGSFDSVRVAIYVTHDSNTFWWEDFSIWVQDSIAAFVVPLNFWQEGCADSVILPNWNNWNNTSINPYDPKMPRSMFRHIVDETTGDTVYNRLLQMVENWNDPWSVATDIESHSSDGDSGHVFLSLIPAVSSQNWWEGSRVLLATLTFHVYMGDGCDTMQICMDSTFWPPGGWFAFWRHDAVPYCPRHFLPVCDTIYTQPTHDVGTISIQSPPSSIPPGVPVTPSATFGNFGDYQETFPVTCRIDSAGMPIYTHEDTVTNLAPGNSIQIWFPPWTPGECPGNVYQVTFYTSLPGDANPANDARSTQTETHIQISFAPMDDTTITSGEYWFYDFIIGPNVTVEFLDSVTLNVENQFLLDTLGTLWGDCVPLIINHLSTSEPLKIFGDLIDTSLTPPDSGGQVVIRSLGSMILGGDITYPQANIVTSGPLFIGDPFYAPRPTADTISYFLSGEDSMDIQPVCNVRASFVGDRDFSFEFIDQDPFANLIIQRTIYFGDGDSLVNPSSPLVYTYDSVGVFEVAYEAMDVDSNVSTATLVLVVPEGKIYQGYVSPFADTNLVEPMGVPFSFIAEKGVCDSVKWYFGDGTTSESLGVTHAFESPGEYGVHLSIWHENFFYLVKMNVLVTLQGAKIAVEDPPAPDIPFPCIPEGLVRSKGALGAFQMPKFTNQQSALSIPRTELTEQLIASSFVTSDQSSDRAMGNFSFVPAVPGDILWNCNVEVGTDNQILGVETLRDTIYITGAGGITTPVPNKVHVWLREEDECVYLYSVDQPTSETWGWHDLTCDGEYLYGSDDRTLEAFYVTPDGVVPVPENNITINGMLDISVIRAVAYCPVHDVFWIADLNSNIYAINRAGNMLGGPFTNPYPVSGMAFDTSSTPGQEWLWCHSQDNAKVYQFNPYTGTYTGVVYSGYGDAGGNFAGGLCVLEGDASKQIVPKVTLLGITQMAPDNLYAMEISSGEFLPFPCMMCDLEKPPLGWEIWLGNIWVSCTRITGWQHPLFVWVTGFHHAIIVIRPGFRFGGWDGPDGGPCQNGGSGVGFAAATLHGEIIVCGGTFSSGGGGNGGDCMGQTGCPAVAPGGNGGAAGFNMFDAPLGRITYCGPVTFNAANGGDGGDAGATGDLPPPPANDCDKGCGAWASGGNGGGATGGIINYTGNPQNVTFDITRNTSVTFNGGVTGGDGGEADATASDGEDCLPCVRTAGRGGNAYAYGGSGGHSFWYFLLPGLPDPSIIWALNSGRFKVQGQWRGGNGEDATSWAGEGGNGLPICCIPCNYKPGTNGGRGGNAKAFGGRGGRGMNIAGARGWGIATCGNGGDGFINGAPPGKGGRGGWEWDDTGRLRCLDGMDGAQCPPAQPKPRIPGIRTPWDFPANFCPLPPCSLTFDLFEADSLVGQIPVRFIGQEQFQAISGDSTPPVYWNNEGYIHFTPGGIVIPLTDLPEGDTARGFEAYVTDLCGTPQCVILEGYWNDLKVVETMNTEGCEELWLRLRYDAGGLDSIILWGWDFKFRGKDLFIVVPSLFRGDANGDGVINSADVVYLINYLFKGGPTPDPLWVGDVNSDGVINSADVVYLINYLFKGGPPPGW